MRRHLNQIVSIDSLALTAFAASMLFFFVSSLSAQEFQKIESTFTIFPSLDNATPATEHVLGSPNDLMSSLSDPSVVKDLEITDPQKAELLAIEKRYAPRFEALIQEASKAGLTRPLQTISSDISKLQKERTKAFENVLLPQQLERIRQVAAQLRIRSQGIGSVLRSGEVSDSLGVTAAQKLKIVEIQKQLQEDLAKEVARLKEDAKNKILNVLDSQQRRNLELLIGDEFQQTQKDWDELYPQSKQSKGQARPQKDASPSHREGRTQ